MSVLVLMHMQEDISTVLNPIFTQKTAEKMPTDSLSCLGKKKISILKSSCVGRFLLLPGLGIASQFTLQISTDTTQCQVVSKRYLSNNTCNKLFLYPDLKKKRKKNVSMVFSQPITASII